MLNPGEIIISHDLGQNLVNFLATKPYAETHQLIASLQLSNAETDKRREAFAQARAEGPKLLNEKVPDGV